MHRYGKEGDSLGEERGRLGVNRMRTSRGMNEDCVYTGNRWGKEMGEVGEGNRQVEEGKGTNV